ncbi:serine hydrolase [Mesobacterium pallidum]|uniref:serine hydrolase n=1 Tax=Mesobacterium pallidum TaxID=2872037 RepID=UPI001EE1FD86
MTRAAAWIDRDGTEGSEGAVGAWPWWSFTKTAIAALALRMERAGRGALDAPVLDDGTTLRDLLLHRAGIANYTDWPDYREAVAAGDAPWPRAEVIARALAAPRDFSLGQGWRYSNSGYALAVSVLEDRGGAALPALMAAHVLGSLAGAVWMPQTAEELAGAVAIETGGYHPHWVCHGLLVGPEWAAARLLRDLLDDLPDEALPLGGALEGRPWTETGYGLGQMIGAVPAPVRGHSGGGPFSTCAVYHFAETGRTVATFSTDPSEAGAEWRCAELGQVG